MESFDRTLRPLLYDPERIVRPFVAAGDRVVDIGCGAGYFSPTLSRLVGPAGELVLVDAQEEMLQHAVEQVRRDPLAQAKLTPILSADSEPSLPVELDFVLMSWMLHEVGEPEGLWRTLWRCMRPAGKVLVIEPYLHVSAARWEEQLAPAETLGFARTAARGVLASRVAVLTR